nr:uncharacterized protein LOC111425858 [Onthophagus taurus]
MNKSIFLISLVVVICHSYTIKSTEKHKHFPVQLSLPQQRKSFQRFYKNHVEIVDCPDGYTFNVKKMTCQMDTMVTDLGYIENSCPNDFRGDVPDPLNCRNFISCYDGVAYLQVCSAHLLFSGASVNCEWPEKSQCCEYPENTAKKFVGFHQK